MQGLQVNKNHNPSDKQEETENRIGMKPIEKHAIRGIQVLIANYLVEEHAKAVGKTTNNNRQFL